MGIGLASSDLADAYTPVHLFTGSSDISTAVGTLVSGQNLAQYAVVGRVAASGKLTEYDPALSNGAEKAIGILLYASDASGGDLQVQFYDRGAFNSASLVWKSGLTAAQKAKAFDGTPITHRTVGYSG